MCVNEMNKNGEKVNRAQLMENERCLRSFQRDNLNEPTFEACINVDERGRVERAEDRTTDREIRKCDSLDVPPPFAFTDAETVNAAAVDGALALTYVLFGGPPVLDADVGLPIDLDKLEAAQCQFEMLKSAGKLEKTVLKQVIKAKKRALKDDAVNSDAALEVRLVPVFISDKKISRAEAKLVKSADKKCDDLVEALDTVFPGSCGDPDLGDVEDCVIAAARCQACLKINAFDGLNLNCDQADDHNVNGSCP
jgi:hypothetical protein